jgi:hypothetical protein
MPRSFTRLTQAALLTAFVLTPGAAAKGPRAPARLIQRTYPVADLVVPIENAPSAVLAGQEMLGKAADAGTTLQDVLMNLISRTVAPQSWRSLGGTGEMGFFPLGMSLVVTQTPEVQQQIGELLADLRRQQGLTVAIEVRFIQMGENGLERFGVEVPPLGDARQKTKTTMLDDLQMFTFFEALQGDRSASILHAPKVTLFNGQAANVNVSETQVITTEVVASWDGQKVVLVPHATSVPLGLQMGLQPVVSADRKSVYLKLKADLSNLESEVIPSLPVTAAGAPEPCMLQAAKVNRVSVQEALKIPVGKTALLGSWKVTREGRREAGTPILSKVPYINRLYKNVGYGRETYTLLIAVTPTIVAESEEEVQAIGLVGAACEESCEVNAKDSLERLLQGYERACTDGRLAQARRLARKALAIDPRCFQQRP